MIYTKLFDPDKSVAGPPQPAAAMGDRTESVPYLYQPEIVLAVNVALATRRPLLVSGPSGCGKSSIAADIKRVLGWQGYEKEIITSRMQAVDLLYKVDHLRQLQDTRTGAGLKETKEYVTPGVLWRAFDPEGARLRQGTDPKAAVAPDNTLPTGSNGVVVLIDEIDKAEPDLPNNLLEPFGRYTFPVRELDIEVRALRTPLLVITTNNERRLSDAFIRRCVDLKIDLPKKDVLMQIAERHFVPELKKYRLEHPKENLLGLVADAVTATSSYSTAEYLDTLRAIFRLGVPETSENFTSLAGLTVRKTAKALGQ
jgi:MoxR-like ATPase